MMEPYPKQSIPWRTPRTDAFVAPSTEKVTFHGRVIKEASKVGSSQIGSTAIYAAYDRILPRITFRKRAEFYLSVGRVQNVVESYKLSIINREWYYDTNNEKGLEAAIEAMEKWEEDINLTDMLGDIILNWIVFGVHILSPDDWAPLQMQSIIAKRRDEFGMTTEYIQVIDGLEHRLPASDFIEIPYINFDREGWGVGMYESLMNRDWLDIDGKDPVSSLELYRQMNQDNMKIHHKYASPRVIYSLPGVNEETIDNDIVPLIEGMQPGDRGVINQELEIKQETVDGTGRFMEYIRTIIDEVDTGLQSSSNRIITEPSAMADAREAGFQDDDRTLGIMEKVRVFMNTEVIPRVTGLERGRLQFKWGSKDTFTLEFPEALEKALDKKVITVEQAQIILQDEFHWKFPTNADVGDLEIVEPVQEEPEPEPEVPQDTAMDQIEKVADKALKTEIIKMVTEMKGIEKDG